MELPASTWFHAARPGADPRCELATAELSEAGCAAALRRLLRSYLVAAATAWVWLNPNAPDRDGDGPSYPDIEPPPTRSPQQGRLAAIAYTLAFAKIRGGGGWLTFAGRDRLSRLVLATLAMPEHAAGAAPSSRLPCCSAAPGDPPRPD